MKTFFYSLLLLSFLSSCAGSDRMMEVMAELSTAQEQLSEVKSEISSHKTAIESWKVDLEVAKDKVNEAREWEFLRTSDEREFAIRQATKEVFRIEGIVEEINKKLSSLQLAASSHEARIEQLKMVMAK